MDPLNEEEDVSDRAGWMRLAPGVRLFPVGTQGPIQYRVSFGLNPFELLTADLRNNHSSWFS